METASPIARQRAETVLSGIYVVPGKPPEVVPKG